MNDPTQHSPPLPNRAENSSIPDAAFRCDLLLFVVTSTEKEELQEAARELEIPFQRRKGKTFRYYDLGKIGDNKVMAVRTEMGPFSYNGSASRAINAVIETGATGLIAVGMAFGVDRQRQRIGDVLVSSSLLPYDNRSIVSDGGKAKINYDDVKPHPAKDSLVNTMEKASAEATWQGRVSLGAILTGGAKIHCAQYRDELVVALSAKGEPIIGGEMEGAGMLATCHPDDSRWLVVKGISDFADEKRDEEIEAGRKLACRNAALFVLQALQRANA